MFSSRLRGCFQDEAENRKLEKLSCTERNPFLNLKKMNAYTNVCMCTHTSSHTYMHTYMHINTHMHINAHAHIHIYKHMHIHINLQTHTCPIYI